MRAGLRMAVRTKDRRQQDLFEDMAKKGDWRPPTELPDLSGHKELWVDPENDGRGRFEAKVCGIAVATRDRSWYLPFAHVEGGNMDPERVIAWANSPEGLAGKRIINIATGLDAQTFLNTGIDLEAAGCSLHDVAHTAALLNENRYGGMNLNSLGLEYAGRGKAGLDVRPENIHRAHSSRVGPYAMADAELARDIDLAQRPLSEADGLERVEALEDALIWPNNHMERSAARLDVNKLSDWMLQLHADLADMTMRVWVETGVKLQPNSAASWHELFVKLGLPRPQYKKLRERRNQYGCFVEDVPEGYTDDFLKRVKNDVVQAGLRMRRLESLDSKYLTKYWLARRGDLLPFQLYQLRASEEDHGTIVGRYSSANVNIQQVFKVENQVRRFGEGYIIRELFVPDDGYDMFSFDGSQLQFRLFAHYSRDEELIRKYWEDPDVDFHELVAGLFSLTRQAAKHNNFAMVLGMGREKLANRLELPCTCKDSAWWAKAARERLSKEEALRHIFGINGNHDAGCRARESNDLADRYDKQFPAAKKTMQAIMDVAERRGFVRTLLGRRRRYKAGDRFYSAFAGLLQGSEADMVKSKILTVYRERKAIGVHKLRFPVHDEEVGDIDPDPAAKARLEECLKEEEIKLKVPMVWNAGYGKNWRECK